MTADDRNPDEEGELESEARWDDVLERIDRGWVQGRIGTGGRYRIGRFEAIRELGRGGYGLVLLARDPELDREVALKLLRPPHPEAKRAMFREAQLLARLSHPNVVVVFEAGHHEGDVFYVMERIEGISGHRFIYECESLEQIIDVYIAAGSGLAAAHELGIVHGDFKPANVLIPKDGPVRVVDFGLAQLVYEDGSGLSHRLGTLPYMAPEVLRGEPGDARADQWSFCVALWETLDAIRPYAGETASELLASIERDEPRIVENEEAVPEPLRAVLRAGMAMDPSDRHADMNTLVRELARILWTPGGSSIDGGFFGGTPPPSDDGRLLNAPALREAEAGAVARDRLRFFFYGSMISTAVAVLVGTLSSEPTRPRFAGETLDDSPPAAPTELGSDSGSEQHKNVPIAVTPEQVIGLIEAGRVDDADSLWREEYERRRMIDVAVHADSIQIGEAFLAHARDLANMQKFDDADSAATSAEQWGLAAARDLARYGLPTTESDDLIENARFLRGSFAKVSPNQNR